MRHKILRPFIVKVFVLGYFLLYKSSYFFINIKYVVKKLHKYVYYKMYSIDFLSVSKFFESASETKVFIYYQRGQM